MSPGLNCPKCIIGKLVVTNTVTNIKDNSRTQYFCCSTCKYRPANNKRVVSLDQNPLRK